MEWDLNSDPATYVSRPVFGKFTWRQFKAALILIAITMAAILGGHMLRLDPSIAAAVVAVPGFLAGYFAMRPVHGLMAEVWVPLRRRERESPRELVWKAPMPRMRVTKVQPARDRMAGKAMAKAAEKARKKEEALELETDDALTAALAEIGRS